MTRSGDDELTTHPAPGAVRVPGSERKALASAAARRPAPAGEPIEITLVLRRRAELPETLPAVLTRQELADRYGADPADVEQVRAEVTAAGATVVSVDLGSRRMRVAGPVGVLEPLFGTRLNMVEATDPGTGDTAEFRSRQGALTVPAKLNGLITAVLGLDNRPSARARFRTVGAAKSSVSYTPIEIGQIYQFPDGTDGTGQTVAIIELGGGFGQSDLDTYFAGLELTSPVVTAVGVDGAANVPGQDPSGADGEVLLDIEVVGALAPKATVLVYFAPNTDAGFLDAVSTAAHADPAPAAISISWGQSEDEWTTQAITAMDDAFADAGALGVTVTVAAGDDGSTDRATDSKSHCDFPASSPHALACGGTSLRANTKKLTVTSESVWDNGVGNGATGGGVSDVFGLPSWQSKVGVPASASGGTGRGVPDVAGVADPDTGYQVLIDGTSTVIGGTSAVAPLWAALVARLVQSLGKPLGQLQPVLYQGIAAGQVPAGFRDITNGNNGAYQAGPGWDACTGLGVPVGTALLASLGAAV